MRVQFRRIAGADTRYYEAGEGFPLLLLHGTAMTAEIWCRNIAPLGEGFRVLAPDLLGCGFTEAGAYRGGPPHPVMLDHLEAFADALQLDEFAVAGSSFGALIALLLHLRLKERVPSLVLVSSGSAFNSEEDLQKTYRESRDNGRAVYLDPSYAACVKRMRAIVGADVPLPEALLFAQMTSYALPGALDAFDRRRAALLDIESWRPWRIQPRIAEVGANVLAVFGGKDPRANLGSARSELAKIAGSRLVVFEESRHYPQLEEPERFNAELRGFLAPLHG